MKSFILICMLIVTSALNTANASSKSKVDFKLRCGYDWVVLHSVTANGNLEQARVLVQNRGKDDQGYSAPIGEFESGSPIRIEWDLFILGAQGEGARNCEAAISKNESSGPVSYRLAPLQFMGGGRYTGVDTVTAP